MRRPALFVSHGAPDLAIAAHPAGDWLDSLGAGMTPPRAVLVLSAHDVRERPTLRLRHEGRIVHDYRGFDPALRDIVHPAPEAPALVDRVASLLTGAGIDYDTATMRPLDHGAWVPLHRMDPSAVWPVAQLSLTTGDARAHLALGRALTPLLREDVLLLASGAMTHALGEIEHWSESPACAPDWVRAFADWAAERLEAGEIDALLAWERQAPFGRRNHPTPEHLMPLFVALGAAGPNPTARRLHQSVSRRVLAMDGWAINGRPAQTRRSSIGT